ncbi:MAG: sigma-70 family RNA polymerase sigma factor [Alphaproteobacteria bacterium]|nr:sigma-70 family RNA polymerase sigma factor [Alphaproteobacteria bacterium]
MRDAAPTDAQAATLKKEIVALMPSLRAFSRSLCPNPSRADDLVQDTLVKAIANLHRFEPGSNLRAWLFTILRNTYYSEIRKRQREVEDVEGEHAARLATRPNQPSAADLEDFKTAFAQLSDDHREVLTLVGAAGASYEEAAKICGCAVGTVKSRVNRARARLAALMNMSLEDAVSPGASELLPEGVIAGHP